MTGFCSFSGWIILSCVYRWSFLFYLSVDRLRMLPFLCCWEQCCSDQGSGCGCLCDMSVLIPLDVSSRIAESYSSFSGLRKLHTNFRKTDLTGTHQGSLFSTPSPTLESFPSSSILVFLMRGVLSHGSGLCFPMMSEWHWAFCIHQLAICMLSFLCRSPLVALASFCYCCCCCVLFWDKDLPASASLVLGLKAYTTSPRPLAHL